MVRQQNRLCIDEFFILVEQHVEHFMIVEVGIEALGHLSPMVMIAGLPSVCLVVFGGLRVDGLGMRGRGELVTMSMMTALAGLRSFFGR